MQELAKPSIEVLDFNPLFLLCFLNSTPLLLEKNSKKKNPKFAPVLLSRDYTCFNSMSC